MCWFCEYEVLNKVHSSRACAVMKAIPPSVRMQGVRAGVTFLLCCTLMIVPRNWWYLKSELNFVGNECNRSGMLAGGVRACIGSEMTPNWKCVVGGAIFCQFCLYTTQMRADKARLLCKYWWALRVVVLKKLGVLKRRISFPHVSDWCHEKVNLSSIHYGILVCMCTCATSFC